MFGWPLLAHAAGSGSLPAAKILFFSRSVLFEHPVIHRQGANLSLAEKALVELARQIDCDVGMHQGRRRL